MLPKSAMREKRLRYRTSTDLLSVAVVDQQGRRIRGRVFDLSAGGIGVFMHRKQDPTYHAGSVVRLDMRSPLLREPISSQARVRRIEECDAGRLYGLEFLHWGQLRGRAGILPREVLVFASGSVATIERNRRRSSSTLRISRLRSGRRWCEDECKNG